MSSTFKVPGLDVTATSATFDGAVAMSGALTGAAVVAPAITDPGDAGAIPVTGSGQVALVSAGAETRTLAAPAAAGYELVIAMDVDGGNIVLTCSTGLNAAGNNTATFADASDLLVLRSIKVGANFRWRVVANDGVALSTV